jgi:hypothetical protein
LAVLAVDDELGASHCVNLTTWATIEDLAAFAFGVAHSPIMQRRREW